MILRNHCFHVVSMEIMFFVFIVYKLTISYLSPVTILRTMKRKERDIPNDQSVDPTKPFRFTNRHSIYKQANGEFLARRFRLEFETFTAGPPLCKKQLWNASSTSNELKQHSKKSKFVSQGKQKQLRKRSI